MLKIAHLYPKHLNLYGDRGNIVALAKRLEWRGIDYQIEDIDIGETEKKLTNQHLFFIGGGQDSGQEEVARDIQLRKQELSNFVEAGGVGLAVCGGYQLLGKTYEASNGSVMQGLGVLDIETRAPRSSDKFQDRLIGNVVAELLLDLEPKTLVGFENHGGRTWFSSLRACEAIQLGVLDCFVEQSSPRNDDLRPLAKVIQGYGNNGEDGYEGAIYKNLMGTYLHGSLLPKNPHLADELLRRAITFAGLDLELMPLDDRIEQVAHEVLLIK